MYQPTYISRPGSANFRRLRASFAARIGIQRLTSIWIKLVLYSRLNPLGTLRRPIWQRWLLVIHHLNIVLYTLDPLLKLDNSLAQAPPHLEQALAEEQQRNHQ